MKAVPRHQQRPYLALIVRLGAVGALGTMAMLIKLTNERGIDFFEILFWRQFVSAPILLAWAWLTTGIAVLGTKRLKTHGVRAVYGMIGMVCNFGAVILLPLAEATTFNFTSAIWAVLLSVLILKEKVGIYRWAAVILGFAGVIIIAQPGSGHFPLYGAAVALGGAFMIALISIQIADLGRTEKSITIVFWFATLSTPVLALALPFVFQPHDLTGWLLLLGIGVTGTIGQLLLTAALRFGAVSSVIVMDYSMLFWATLYGWLIWDRFPPFSTWLGAPLIIGAGLVIAWREHRLHRERSTSPVAA
ncbi:MAG TPA: DMT family transporter [Sphingomonadaceae bacterium]|nr:DMT family transporter [Sphingomonadaceae bacterium]